jgi:mannose-6-phosphate isomerase-like protein (cupin superfamily)
MKPLIKKINKESEFYTEEKCFVNELSNTSDDKDISIARCRVLKGVTTNWHRLQNTTERYVILEGNGIVEIGNIPKQNVSAGDVVVIPPMCRQRITNNGNADLIFLAICSPRFVQQNYTEI